MDTLTIRRARAADPDVAPLIETHHALMRASSPEESCHVQDAGALDREGAVVLVAERGGDVLAVGAVKRIAPGHGEIKSMHTAAAARGQGLAREILRALVSVAREDGLERLSLETGSAELFAPARALYAAEGFETCPPFGDYRPDPLSTFMTRSL